MKTSLKWLGGLSLALLLLLWGCKKDPDPVAAKSSEKSVTAFAFNSLSPAVTGSVSGNTITAAVPFGTSVSALVPTIALSPKATVSPGSGVAQDFSKAVRYTITAEDGSTQVYSASVSVGPSPLALDKAAFPNQQRGSNFLSSAEYQAVPLIATPAVKGGRRMALPTLIDLASEMPPVGDQGAQGSCVGWSTSYALRSYLDRFVRKTTYLTGTTLNPQTVFSPAYVYNQLNNGKDEGTNISSALNLLVSQGSATLADMPYTATNFTTQPTADQKTKASSFKLKEWGRVSLDLAAMKAFLANKNPIVFAVTVDGNMTRTSDMFDTEVGWRTYNPATVRGGHAMVIVGYSDARNAFKVQNSWGTNWGNKGFFWMDYGLLPYIREAYVAIVDGKNYLEQEAVSTTTINETVFFGSADKYVYAVDAKTSLLKWRFLTGGDASNSVPVLAKGILYAASTDEKLYALNAADGSKKWEIPAIDGSTNPALANGLLYLIGGYTVLAFDAATGEKKWTFDGSDNGTRLENLTISGGVVYVGGSSCCAFKPNSYFYAIDALTGAKKWEVPLANGSYVKAPAIADGVVYVNTYKKSDLTTATLLALDATTGTQKSALTVPGSIFGTSRLPMPVLSGGLLYLTASSKLLALDPKTNTQKWAYTARDVDNSGDSNFKGYSPVVQDGVLYASDATLVYAFDPITGTRKWQYGGGRSDPLPNSSPTAANGIVYVGYFNYGGQSLRAIDGATGLLLWSFKTGSGAGQPCVVDANGKVFRGSLAPAQ